MKHCLTFQRGGRWCLLSSCHSTHSPPHEQSLMRLGVGGVSFVAVGGHGGALAVGSRWWWGWDAALIIVVAPVFVPLPAAIPLATVTLLAIVVPLAVVIIPLSSPIVPRLATPHFHPVSSCSQQWLGGLWRLVAVSSSLCPPSSSFIVVPSSVPCYCCHPLLLSFSFPPWSWSVVVVVNR